MHMKGLNKWEASWDRPFLEQLSGVLSWVRQIFAISQLGETTFPPGNS